MSAPQADSREERLDQALAAYLKAAQADGAVDRRQWLDRYPDLAAELAEFFADQDRLEALAGPLRQPRRRPADPVSDGPVPEHGRLGDYQIVCEVGRGGMGVVYEAEQPSLRRRVALKVIRAGWLASPSEVQRFRAEAEAAASLDHPHIVPIYEVGEYQGSPFFSMKLVEGGSLADRLDRYPRDPRAAARLVALVARAVQHAHQRGVLHRDLKPSNILLDADGRPHVTDFGLAKRLEGKESLTESGALVGTPGYMAPEQAAGLKEEITTASDVYGLGAVLYALLTGRPPFRADTAMDTLLLVREREPEPPRRLQARVDRDLETICLKCLHKDPRRRYGSAEALAEDLEHWLRGEPIKARRAGAWDRLRKWVLRRPALAALLTLAVWATVGLVAGLFWHNAQLRRAAQREQHQRQLARQAVDRMYVQVATRWLADEPQLTGLQRQFLEEALHFYQELAREEVAEPALRRDAAQVHRYMGDILAKLERRAEAQQAYEQALAMLEHLVAEYPDQPDYAHELASACTGLGNLHRYAGRDEEARTAFRRGLEIEENLVQKHPERADYQERLGILYLDLSNLVAVPEAEKGLHRARSLYEQLLAGSPNQDQFHTTLGGILNNLAIQRLREGQPAQARPLLEQAIAQQQAALKTNPRSRTALRFLRNHYSILGGDVLRALGEREAALKSAREGLAVAQRLAREFPEVPSYEDTLADSQHDVGQILRDLGRLGEAEGVLRQARDLREKAVARSPHVAALQGLLAETCTALGSVLAATGQDAEAAAVFRRALKLNLSEISTKVDLIWAVAVWGTGTGQDAARAVALARQTTEQAPGVWNCWNALGAALYRAGDWQQAREALEKAIELQHACPPPTHLFLAMTQWRLGHKEDACGRYRQVSEWLDRNGKQEPEWRRLQAECALLLGLAVPSPQNKELPAKQ